MQFLFPTFLWTLILLSIPVLIHLFYFRRYKKVYFTNVHFLKELVEETATKNKIKNILILLCRLAAIIGLIFAFAQPFFTNDSQKKKQSQAVSIYIDNSWSMNANAEDGSLVQKAKRRAKEIITAYSDNDRFQILTNDLDGKHQRLVSKEDAISLLEEIQSGPSVQTLSKILFKQKQCLQNAKLDHGDLYMLSDFQASICDLDSLKADSLYQLYLLPIQTIQENNLSLDTAYFESPVLLPGQTNTLIYQVSNYGSTDAQDIRSSFTLNGQDYPGSSLNIKSGKSVIDSLKINIQSFGWQKLIVKIKDYPIQFDDSYYMSCKSDEEINVLLLYEREPPAQVLKMISSIPYFQLKTQQQNKLDYSKFKNNKLILLSDLSEISSGMSNELMKAVSEGMNVLIFPAADLGASNYRPLSVKLSLPELRDFSLTKKEATKANFESDIFNDVYINSKASIKLPSTMGQYEFYGGLPSEKIIEYRDGSAMINRYKIGKGSVFISASPLDIKYNELSKNAEIFLPLLFKTAFSSDLSRQLSYDLTSNPVILWQITESLVKQDLYIILSGPDELIPSIKLANNQLLIEVYDQIKKAGIYDVKNQNNILGSIAFNDSRKESNLKVWNPKILKEQYGNFTNVLEDTANEDFTSAIQSEQAGPTLWWWMLIVAFVFLILETLLIRLWKTD
ncbi:MAG: BatA domain-containing protein [Saprospiraceae bacterium]